MILDELVLHNVGPFRSRNALTLSPPRRERPIVLIGGLNGNGKTTVLESIHLCLYGRQASFCRASELAYEEQLRRLIHRGVRPEDGACIELAFRSFEGGSERTFRVRRSWSAIRERVKEHVDVEVDGARDPGLSDSWADEVQRFLPANLADLFFFDGERIEGFADPARSRTLLATAVHSLLGVDLVQQLVADLDVLVRRRLKGTARADVRPELAELESRTATLAERRSDLLQREAARRAECGQLEARVQSLEVKLGSDPCDPGAKRRELDRLQGAMHAQIDATNQSLVDLAAGCLPVALIEGKLRAALGAAQSEVAHRRASLISVMLADRDERITHELRKTGVGARTIERLTEVLAEDRQRHAPVGQVPDIVGLSDVAVHDVELTVDKRLPEQVAAAVDLVKRRASQAASLDELERRLVVAPDERELGPTVAMLEDTRRRLQEAQRLLRLAEEEREAADRELQRLRERELEISRQQREAGQSAEDAERFARFASRGQELLAKFRTRLVAQRVSKLEHFLLSGFRQLMRKESLVLDLKIDPGSCELRLLGKGGIEIHPARLSAGERQILATAILWGLARASGRPVPVVIDTPLGRLDSRHRELLADRYFPHASHQVILLSTDQEIDRGLLDRLGQRIGRTYRLVHDDGLSATHIEEGYFW